MKTLASVVSSIFLLGVVLVCGLLYIFDLFKDQNMEQQEEQMRGMWFW